MEIKPSNKSKTGVLNIYYILFIAILILGLLSNSEYIYISTMITFFIIIIFDIKSLKEFQNPTFWILLLTIGLTAPLLLGPKDAQFWFIPYSSENLNLSMVMLQRALIIYSAVIIFTRNVSIMSLVNFFSRMGFKDFGLSLSIAINLIPVLQRNITNIYNSFLLRGGFKHNIIKNSFKFAVVVIVNSIRTAEEIAEIIEVKGILS